MNLLNRISVYCFIKDINDIKTGRIREIICTVTRTYDLSSSSLCRTYAVGGTDTRVSPYVTQIS